MSGDSMDMEESRAEKIQSLQALATGPFSSSLSTLSSSSKALPSDKDFHFFYNFDEFKLPISEIAEKSQSVLESIGSSTGIWGDKPIIYPQSIEIDGDDAYDWLVNINDEIFERFDVSIDEFQRVRKKEEETGRSLRSVDVDNGFQLVYGKKKKKGAGDSMSRRDESASSSGVSVKKTAASVGKAKVGKAKVPFHIPTIRKPQEAYNILVNNANQPFEHVWLQRSDDGQRVIHPLEKLSVMDFVDKDMVDVDPVEPPSIEATPFKLVEEVKDLKELSAKLRNVNEFAVDLEHNQYRSFQGLTCLMQISTRTEDFIVDTLKLRIHMGPYLREIFKDPTKKKVMHGADRDILWLQRDFGIYICNLFDTGQASRVLKLERNSLEYLLHNFCGVTANKEYQNADWRLRPLPHEMVRYAREDTHYLLYIYDIMKSKLQSMPKESDHSDAPLVEVYKRSYDVCMLLYEKELLTETSYIHIYGLQEASFDAEQLAVVAGLCKWRDVVARAEDESTGYILPNKTLLEIAKQMPRSEGRLRKLLKSKHPYVERNIGSVLNIIKHSTQNSAAFEAALHQLRGKHVSGEMSAHKKRAEHVETEIEITEKTEDVVKTPDSLSMQAMTPQLKQEESESGNNVADHQQDECSLLLKQSVENGTSTSARDSVTTLSCVSKEIIVPVIPPPKVVVGATVSVLKKPSRGLGALIGSASSKRKIDISKKDKEEIKLEQIRSLVNLPFHSFSGEQLSKPEPKERASVPEISQSEEPPLVAHSHADLRDTIMLDSSPDARELKNGSADKTDVPGLDNSAWSCLDANEDDDPVSLSDLSTSFGKCFQPIEQTVREGAEKSKEPEGLLQFKAFDYEAARKQVRFGINAEKKSGSTGENQGSLASRRKDSDVARDKKDDRTGELRQGGRRQAFPASGNRSATFRS